jgi:hypothetical protein
MIELDMLFSQDEQAKVSVDYFSDMGLECLKKIITDSEYVVFSFRLPAGLMFIHSSVMDTDAGIFSSAGPYMAIPETGPFVIF